MNTNIKNLPADRTYFTEFGYSQQYPWVEVKRTAKDGYTCQGQCEERPGIHSQVHPRWVLRALRQPIRSDVAF